MSQQYLAAYLNDHLAGTVAALELLAERAKDQRWRAETARLEAARAALGNES
ncbi:MAG: hypothetical protein ACREQ2_03425 [Candidatus Binatia bacterium]